MGVVSGITIQRVGGEPSYLFQVNLNYLKSDLEQITLRTEGKSDPLEGSYAL